MPIKINGATSGYVQLSAPDVAGNTDLTLPSGTGTIATTAYADTAGGLQLIATTDVTGTSGIFNNVFSATYNNYLVILTGSVSTARSLQIRPRASGSNITTNLSRQRLYAESTTVGANYAVNWNDAMVIGVNSSTIVMNWADPFLTKKSSIATHCATSNAAIFLSSYAHEADTSYDGFEIFIDAGSVFTVTVKIYGYRNS